MTNHFALVDIYKFITEFSIVSVSNHNYQLVNMCQVKCRVKNNRVIFNSWFESQFNLAHVLSWSLSILQTWFQTAKSNLHFQKCSCKNRSNFVISMAAMFPLFGEIHFWWSFIWKLSNHYNSFQYFKNTAYFFSSLPQVVESVLLIFLIEHIVLCFMLSSIFYNSEYIYPIEKLTCCNN